MEEKITETLTEKIARWESIYADTVRRHELMEMGFKSYWANKVNDTTEIDELKHDVDLIKEAAQKGNNFKDFFSHLDSGCTQYLIDINTPEFKGNLDSFIRRKADFENCNAKTMKALKQAAGITPEKVRKDKNLER